MLALRLQFLWAWVLVAMLGCVHPTPVLDSHFGDAVNTAKAQQTIHPDAAKTQQPDGIDGQAAKSAIELYQQSFAQPTVSPNVFNIGVGSGSGSTGSQ